MFIHYRIQLCGNLREVLIQIKRLYADLIAAHLVAVVRLDCFVRCRIKEHTGNCVWLVPELCILVLDVGKNLIQIARVQRVNVILRLPRDLNPDVYRLNRDLNLAVNLSSASLYGDTFKGQPVCMEKLNGLVGFAGRSQTNNFISCSRRRNTFATK